MVENARAFVVEPYLKASGIRSPLGFMSQATRWAQLLFPGITVLTRDFLHVELLHRELRSRKKAGESRNKIEEVLRSPAVHRRLEREYKGRVGDEDDATVTRMTYWQRYGSLFEYFGLWSAPRSLRRKELWSLVFSGRIPNDCRAWWTHPEPLDNRQRRIRHTRWYLRFQDELVAAGQVPPRLLWWVTGDGGPGDVSEDIKLSRRLSYAFLIWQTLFEVGIKLRFRGHALPKASSRPVNASEAVALLVQATDGEPGSDVLKRVFSGLLSAHVHQLRRGMPSWQAKVERKWHDGRLTTLYDGTPVKDLATLPASSLFYRLVELHQYYCRWQGKPDAEFIRPVRDTFRPLKFAAISASFRGTPWGLFGYRLDQAATLYRSGVGS
jgi:hypothetical protein